MNEQERPAARAVVLDPDGRALLADMAPNGADVPRLWLTPGGGLEAGESWEEALRRELWEETGLRAPIGPCVWHRRHRWRWGDRWILSVERFYVVRTEPFAPRSAVPTAETALLRGWRWWSAEELIAAEDQVFVPRRFGALLRDLLHALPPEPIDVGV